MSTMTRRLASAVFGLNVRYTILPANQPGTVVTCGAGAWAAYADLVALAAVATEFFICGFHLDTAGAGQVFELQVADATPTVLTEARLDLTAATVQIGWLPAGPYPIRMPPGAQVQARSGGAAAKVLGVSIVYATGL